MAILEKGMHSRRVEDSGADPLPGGRGRRHVLELGAGQGLVGLACAIAGAERVTLTGCRLPFSYTPLGPLQLVVSTPTPPTWFSLSSLLYQK